MSKLNPVIKGLGTYIPGVYRTFSRTRTGGSDQARYCYDTWLKHMTMLWENGLRAIPATVAELGPGDSLGSGLAALLSGATHYVALDVVQYADAGRNVAVFDELVELFRKRTPRPVDGWPDYGQYLGPSLFPHHILPEDRLNELLAAERVAAIRDALLHVGRREAPFQVRYVVPWTDASVVEPASVGLIFSHSVLEHVNDLETTYRAFGTWLEPGGWMSHQIDFRSHGITQEWNGHWTYSDLLWKVVAGRRPFLLNRQPVSRHHDLLEKNKFTIITELHREQKGGRPGSELAAPWRDMPESDVKCSGAFFQARKPGGTP